jgi:Uma2 family endonuclease
MSSFYEKAPQKDHYTYTDFLSWDDDDVYAEIIDGEVYLMNTPATEHQRVSMALVIRFGFFLEGKTCQVFHAPYGVRLFPKADESDDTVVIPDILVVCDAAKIDERGCNGAPDLIIEILSPSTISHDRVIKFNKYLQAGVREYWIIDTATKSVQVFVLSDGKYVTEVYGINASDTPETDMVEDIVPVTVLPGLKIDLKQIFP